MTHRTLASALALGLSATVCTSGHAQERAPTSRPSARPTPGAELPPEFQRLLPKGRIAAIRDPRFVAGSEATVSPDAWVLGVVVKGKARAYALSLLNRHEVVNDTLAGTAFAAVW
jgi:hypothetical protein